MPPPPVLLLLFVLLVAVALPPAPPPPLPGGGLGWPEELEHPSEAASRERAKAPIVFLMWRGDSNREPQLRGRGGEEPVAL